jgi:hypothetical protein
MHKFIGGYKTVYRYFGRKIDDVCFGQLEHLFKPGRQDCTLYIVKDPNYGFNEGYWHNCLITRKELVSLLNSFKNVFTIKYKITDSEMDEYDAYEVNIKFKTKKYYVVLFILTVLRYSYEFPYNVILRDAFKLTKLSEFKWMNLISLCNLVQSCTFNDWDGRTLHGLLERNNACNKTKKSIHHTISRVRRIHRIFKPGKIEGPLHDKARNTLEYWTDEKQFERRLEVYKKNLKNFKQK